MIFHIMDMSIDTILFRKEFDRFWIWILKMHDRNQLEKNAE